MQKETRIIQLMPPEERLSPRPHICRKRYKIISS
jgi:hypothetical protein